MAVNLGRSNRIAAQQHPKLHDGEKKGGIKQDPFTTKIGKSSGSERGLQKLVDSVQKTKEDGMKMFIEIMKRPSVDEGKQDNSAALAASFQSSSAQAEAAVITAKAAEIQEKAAAMQQAQMVGKSVKVASSRTFSSKPGERVTFKFDIARNIPKDASISGTIHVLDANKRKVRSETIRHMKAGKNDFSWDGLTDSGRPAEAGQYTIQVSASYKTPGNNNSIPAIVNTMTEAKIVEIDIHEWEATLSDGSIVSMSDIGKFFDKEAMDKTKKASTPPSISKAKEFLHQHVVVKEDKATFEGEGDTKLGFHCPEDKDKVFVKVVAKHDREIKSVEIKEMDLKQGRNEFVWSGERTITEDDFKAKEEGKQFGKVGYGEYDYVIYVADDMDGPWKDMSPKSEVYVEGTQEENGITMLALKGGGLVPASKYDGLAKILETGTPLELSTRAAAIVGKGVEVPRIARFNGTDPYERTLPIVFGQNVETEITVTFIDSKGSEVKTINFPTAATSASLDDQLIYDNLNDESKAKLVQWIGPPQNDFWEFTRNGAEVKYENLDPANKPAVDAHIIAQVKAGSGKADDTGYHLKKGFSPSMKVEWDGKDYADKVMDAGDYAYKYTIEVTDTASGETHTENIPEIVPLLITRAEPRDGRIIATLMDSREIEITPETVFVA